MARYMITYKMSGAGHEIIADSVEHAFRTVYGHYSTAAHVFVIDADAMGQDIDPYGIVSNRDGDDVAEIRPMASVDACAAADREMERATEILAAADAKIDDLRAALADAEDARQDARDGVRRARDAQIAALGSALAAGTMVVIDSVPGVFTYVRPAARVPGNVIIADRNAPESTRSVPLAEIRAI